MTRIYLEVHQEAVLLAWCILVCNDLDNCNVQELKSVQISMCLRLYHFPFASLRALILFPLFSVSVLVPLVKSFQVKM